MVEHPPRIDVIGLAPGSRSGPSVYVDRLSRRLEEEGFSVVRHPAYLEGKKSGLNMLSPSVSRFLSHFLSLRGDIIHLNARDWKLILGVAITSLLKQVNWALTIHGGFRSWPFTPGKGALTGWSRRFFEFLTVKGIQAADAVVVVNPDLGRQVTRMGIPPDKVRIITPFIPPSVENLDPIPENIENFLADHSPVLLGLAAIRRVEGVELYGVDMMIDALNSLRESMPSAGLLLIVNRVYPEEREYYEDLLSSIQRRGLGDGVLIHGVLPSISALYPRCTVFLRPTLADGDALSVRESLHVGLPTVASDASPRPGGVMTFRSRDTGSLIHVLKDTVQNAQKIRRKLRSRHGEGWRRIISTYHEINTPRKSKT